LNISKRKRVVDHLEAIIDFLVGHMAFTWAPLTDNDVEVSINVHRLHLELPILAILLSFIYPRLDNSSGLCFLFFGGILLSAHGSTSSKGLLVLQVSFVMMVIVMINGTAVVMMVGLVARSTVLQFNIDGLE
jgi:hypothetical protein